MDVKDEPPAPRGTGYARRGAAGGFGSFDGRARRCVYLGYASKPRGGGRTIGNDTAGTRGRSRPTGHITVSCIPRAGTHAAPRRPAGRPRAVRWRARGAAAGRGTHRVEKPAPVTAPVVTLSRRAQESAITSHKRSEPARSGPVRSDRRHTTRHGSTQPHAPRRPRPRPRRKRHNHTRELTRTPGSHQSRRT